MNCRQCDAENPPQAKFCLECGTPFTQLDHADPRDRPSALIEARERETATSEILRVIGSSPTDVQPVFEVIGDSALRLCRAWSTSVWRLEAGVLRVVSAHGGTPGSIRLMLQRPPMPADSAGLWTRVIAERSVFEIVDVETDARIGESTRELARARGWRARLDVPMVRGQETVGLISVTHAEPGPFASAHVELLKTFADQAVIAIENVRLFNETKDALERQTATAEILRVISSSPTDAQPVFEAIAESAVRLMGAVAASMYEFDGRLVHLRTLTPADWPHADELRRQYPRPPDLNLAAGRVILKREILHLADLQTDPATPSMTRQIAERMGLKSVLWVPMLRDGAAIGVIGIIRATAGFFSDKQIALLQTFADQAVIAIENVRLFTELQEKNRALTEALEQQTATAEILGVISSSPTDVQPVFETIVASCKRLLGARSAAVLRLVDEQLHLAAFTPTSPEADDDIRRFYPTPLDANAVVATVARDRAPFIVNDTESDARLRPSSREVARSRGYRSMLVVPMLRRGETIGTVSVSRESPGSFSDKDVALLQTFADQAVIAIENVRLVTELQERTSQLQVANRHKDEFLSNMSHELRTPLNAVIGFSDVLLEGMFGEVNDKQTEYLHDIVASGKHLLSLINDILDLSKIEAGRMELDLSDFDVLTAIENALTVMRERASRHEIKLSRVIGDGVGEIRADERKFKQVLLNLLSNAVKFTPAGGSVEVRTGLRDGFVEVAVADTGEGIAPEHQQAVFEEFRQVGKSSKKVEGTGLGLALCRKFVELHGGTIALESQVGVGSTFTFTVPVRSPGDASVLAR